MPYVQLPGGIVAHVKMAKPRRRLCCATGCTTASTKQCDFAIGAGKTCDAYICSAHATSVGPDIDHCPKHAGRQAGLFTGLT
jgi:hypothetical protein